METVWEMSILLSIRGCMILDIWAADYTIENDNSYLVHLKAEENKSILVDLKVSVGSNKQARNLCKKWKEDSSSIYTSLMNLLFNEQ